jgi:16S rRNA (adenine1518-N6/adenine1519-N6)-dimethyltransferase
VNPAQPPRNPSPLRPGELALDHPLDVPGLLRQYELRARKSLGQNFLTDPAILRRIVQAAELPAGARILEIGPGLGSLTRFLALGAKQVVAVELDEALIPILEEVVAPLGNVRVVQGDILKLDPQALMGDEPYYVAANIPYYITSAVIRHLLEARKRPFRLALTVQREVAERICAEPGDMSLLALSVQVYGRPTVAARIPAKAFYPPPKVDSAVVRVDVYDHPAIPAAGLANFFRLIKAGFSQKRKTLRNALAGGLGWPPAQAEELLRRAGIDPMRRAETLSIQEWGDLVEQL